MSGFNDSDLIPGLKEALAMVSTKRPEGHDPFDPYWLAMSEIRARILKRLDEIAGIDRSTG